MQFFLRLCREVVFEMSKPHRSEPADIPRKDRYLYGILFSQMMFEELARNKGFSMYSTFKSLWDKEQSFFRKQFSEKGFFFVPQTFESAVHGEPLVPRKLLKHHL